MSDTGKQSPLGVNVLGSLLGNQGFNINPTAAGYFGESKTNSSYSPGSIVNTTCLKWLTYAINISYNNANVNTATYNNMLNIGQSRIPALGNSPPPTYVFSDPSGVWSGQATSGYSVGTGEINQEQNAKWLPWNKLAPNGSITQWGWIRLLALQAWNEFNWNGPAVAASNVSYKDFLSSFLQADSFINYTNQAILASQNSKEFLKGTYSNMNDLMSADISGVSLSSRAFGQDLINLGRAIDFTTLNSFGLPSNLLRNLKKNNALTQNLNLAMIAAGLAQEEIDVILTDISVPISVEQEQKLYGAFLIINGSDLTDILVPLNCKTQNLTALADLLNVKKLFPISYTTLTVPIYNTTPGPTNSKTYYLLFVNQELNPQLVAPAVKAQVGLQIPVAPPPVVNIEPSKAIIEQAIIETVLAGKNVEPVIQTYNPPGTSGGGGCIVLDSFVPYLEEKLHNNKPITQAYQLESGMKILLGDEKLNLVHGIIRKALIDYQPCLKIQTSDGISLICSHSAKIYTKEHGYLLATELFGKRVGVMRHNKTYNNQVIMHPTVFYDEVVSIIDVGMKYVRVIDSGDNAFWAGEKQGSYILHHNVKITNELNYNKN